MKKQTTQNDILNTLDIEYAGEKISNRKVPAKTNKLGLAGNTANLMVVSLLNEGTMQERLDIMSTMILSIAKNQIEEEILSGSVLGANSKGTRVADGKAIVEAYQEIQNTGQVSVETFNKWFTSESKTVPTRVGKYWRQYSDTINELTGIHVSMPDYSSNKTKAAKMLKECRKVAPEFTL